MTFADEMRMVTLKDRLAQLEEAGTPDAVEPLLAGDDVVFLTPAHPVSVSFREGLAGSRTLRGQCEHLPAEVVTEACWTPARSDVLLCRECVDAEADVITATVCHACLGVARLPLTGARTLRLVRAPQRFGPAGWLELWLGLCSGCLAVES